MPYAVLAYPSAISDFIRFDKIGTIFEVSKDIIFAVQIQMSVLLCTKPFEKERILWLE